MDVTDKREGMANQLLMRGHATMLELMTASFGEWPPKGLDVSPGALPEQKVDLRVFAQNSTKGKKLRGQAADIDSDVRYIDIRDNLFGEKKPGGGLNTTLGHESVHILQGDHTYRKAAIFGKHMGLLKRIGSSLFGQNEAISDQVMNKLLVEGQETKRLYSIEFNRASATREEQSKTVKRMNYLSQGVEVQARIHEVMINGYQRWGKLPATPDEFNAALKNAGFKMSDEIEKRLENLPANSSAQHFLKCEKGTDIQALQEIQKVADSFSQEGSKTFWNKIMPALYADLIEMYGDKQGGQKMGFSANIQADVAQTVKATLTAKQTTPSPS